MERLGQLSDADKHPLIDVDEVRTGDLLFTARDGTLQWLCEVAGDPWRHAGIATEIDGDMCITEVGGDFFSYRSLREVLPSQSAVGVARVAPHLEDCAARAAAWARSMLEEEQIYAWDDMILAGLVLATRKRLQIRDFDRVVAAIGEAERRAQSTRGPSMTCSGFVYESFRQVGAECRLEVVIEPLWSRPVPERGARPRPLSLDELAGAPLVVQLEQLDQRSLYELSGYPAGGHPRYRSGGGTRMSVSQLAETVRSLVHLVAGFAGDATVPAALPMDGRWVTPGDLWRLPDHQLKGFLKAPADRSSGDARS